jgi:hypothetical protein
MFTAAVKTAAAAKVIILFINYGILIRWRVWGIANDFRYLATSFAALVTRPKGIHVAHLLGHMQTGIHAGCLHLIKGLDDIGIEDFPRTCKRSMGGWPCIVR